MTDRGWMPDAERIPTPNFTEGRNGLAMLAVVLHIMDGPFVTSINWMKKAGTSAHFDISKRGRIVQQVSIVDTAYANGLSYKDGVWIDPDGNRVRPPWPLLHPPYNPNYSTISIEHEGRPGEPLTPAMVEAQTKVLRWIGDELSLVYIPGTSLIGHRDIGPIHRARCPGPAFDFPAIAAAANSPDRYRVKWDNTYVREAPRLDAPIAWGNTCFLPAGMLVDIPQVVTGDAFRGDNRWAHWPPGGFIWLNQLERVT